jgi:hypothetical protein
MAFLGSLADTTWYPERSNRPHCLEQLFRRRKNGENETAGSPNLDSDLVFVENSTVNLAATFRRSKRKIWMGCI